MPRFRLILLGGLAAAVAGCGGGGGGDGGPPTITSVVVSGDSTVVLAGTRQLTATAMAGSTPISTGVTFQWSSSDTTRARVSGSGLVTGVRLGSTTITALAVLNGTPTSVSSSTHAVRTRIGTIVFTPSAPSFASLHDTIYVSADARDAQNASVPGVTFTWQSRSAAVATAADSGTHKAIVASQTNGTARIVARGDGVSDSITATVQQVATSFSITPDTTTFDRIGATVTPTVTATDARGIALSAGAISWNSLNTAAATVNATTGVITSVNEGQTRVTGASGSLSDTIRVGVALVYSSIQIATSGATPVAIDSGVINRLNGALQLGVIVRDAGNTVVPGPQGVAWSLKTGTIASIGASSGLVTGNSNTGHDTIAVAARGVVDSALLVVRQVVATIAVTPATPQPLNFVGDTQRFTAQPRDSGGASIPGKTVTWSTGRPVLSIDANGLARADSSLGLSGILVRVKATVDAFTDSLTTIRVRQVPATADLNPNSFGTLTAFGRQASASCVVRDSANDTIVNHPCNWSAGTAGVVSFFPPTGKTTTVTAVGNGNTTIQAQAAIGVVGFNSITVDQVPAALAIIPANFGPTPDVQMVTNQSAPFFVVVRDSLGNRDSRDYSLDWTATGPLTVAASSQTFGPNPVTTGSTPGSGFVTATLQGFSLTATRNVDVVSTGVRFGGTGGVQSVFTANCISCHTGAGAPQGMSLASGVAYGAIVNVAAGEVPALKRVSAFRPDSSYLVHKIQGTQTTVGGSGARMPFGCTTNCLPNATINLIRNWILQGALNN